mgnify:CR=1 FL=1
MIASKNKQSLMEFKYLRAIGIILVVLGHSFPFIDSMEILNSHIYKYIHSLIYSFHMPLFIMISGFFGTKILKINSFKEYKAFISDKFQKLIIPYLTISVFTIPIKFILNKFSQREIVLSDIVKDVLLYPWNNPIIFFWFIYVLFLIFVFSPIIAKLNKYLVLITFLIFSIFPIKNIELMGISTILKYSIFFFIGVYSREFYINNRMKILNFKFGILNSLIFIIIPLIVFLLNINLNFVGMNEFFSTIIINSFFILKAFLGIYICFVISKIIFNVNQNQKFLNLLSDYLLSWFPQVFLRILDVQILKSNYMESSFAYGKLSIISSLFGLIIPILVSMFLLRKFKITRKLVLGIVR